MDNECENLEEDNMELMKELNTKTIVVNRQTQEIKQLEKQIADL